MDDYPSINLEELHRIGLIIDNYVADPKYLDSPNCPYDAKTKQIFKGLAPNRVTAATLNVQKGRAKAGAKKKSPNISTDDLQTEFLDLRKEINSLKVDAKMLEPHDRIQVVKTRAMLVEKILSMKERIENIVKQEKFILTVIEIMEDELPQELRLKIIDRLKPFAEQE